MEYYSAIKKEQSVVGCGLGVKCSLSMQKALCSILGTTGKKVMGLIMELIDGHGTWKDLRYTTIKDHATQQFICYFLSSLQPPTECSLK